MLPPQIQTNYRKCAIGLRALAPIETAPEMATPIEPPEIQPPTPGNPTEPPPEGPPGNPRPEVPPPAHEPGEPAPPDNLPGERQTNFSSAAQTNRLRPIQQVS